MLVVGVLLLTVLLLYSVSVFFCPSVFLSPLFFHDAPTGDMRETQKVHCHMVSSVILTFVAQFPKSCQSELYMLLFVSVDNRFCHANGTRWRMMSTGSMKWELKTPEAGSNEIHIKYSQYIFCASQKTKQLPPLVSNL